MGESLARRRPETDHASKGRRVSVARVSVGAVDTGCAHWSGVPTDRARRRRRRGPRRTRNGSRRSASNTSWRTTTSWAPTRSVHAAVATAPTTSTPRFTSRSCSSASSPAITALELVTGIIILPQRQTALVAKQAAEVDLLTGGRFRLGVGLGWNAVEYEALGKEFSDRGRRSEEQIACCAGCGPSAASRSTAYTSGSPAQAWLRCRCSAPSRSGSAELGARATSAWGGWPTVGFPRSVRAPKLDEARAMVDDAARAAGRDPAAIGMEGRANWSESGIGTLVDQVERWRCRRREHLSVNTMGADLATVDAHLAVLTEVASALELGDASSPSDGRRSDEGESMERHELETVIFEKDGPDRADHPQPAREGQRAELGDGARRRRLPRRRRGRLRREGRDPQGQRPRLLLRSRRSRRARAAPHVPRVHRGP